MDCAKLEELITKLGVENVPLVFTTITNNTVCGQAVSMKSIKETAKICEKYDIPLKSSYISLPQSPISINNGQL